MSRISEALAWARTRLGGGAEAAGEARYLLAHALKCDPAWLFAHPEHPLETSAEQAFRERVERRARGEPVAYLTGEREFWSLPLEVGPHTLIPRPETEHLIEFVLRTLPRERPLRVIDLGTGSGAIALALARECPAWRIAACERSPAALAQARRNGERLGLRVDWILADWMTGIQGPFDLVIGNPPYVAEADPHLRQGDLRHEPPEALASGPDGLDAIRRIVPQAARRLAPGGRLVLEHGHQQGPACRELLRQAGFERVASGSDLAGLERFTHGQQPGKGREEAHSPRRHTGKPC